jgi:hypothetical protein
MKKITALFFAFAFCYVSFSQTRVGIALFNKKEVPAVMGEIPYEEGIVKDAIDKHFEKMGYKGKKVKDYVLYSSTTIADLGAEPHDIYVMIDKKSRQEKGTSVVTFLISKGFEEFADETNDPTLIGNTRVYLTNLRDVVAAHDLELQIAEQEDVVKKHEKKHINLQEDGISLLKKKKKIEEEIAQNTIEQNIQKNEKERQQQILETLKNKRKN